MAKTLGATTTERVARAQIAPLWLMRLRTFSDRAAETVDRTFYFSSGPGALYQWSGEGSAQLHDAALALLGDLAVSMPHRPSGAAADIPAKALEIELANLPFEGSRLAAVLRGYTLENAKVDLAQVLLEDEPSAPFLDVTAEESLVWYRGRVRQWGPISNDRIPLLCETDFPQIPWLLSTERTEVQPKDIGRRYPKPYGEAKRVKAIGRKVGWVTTLAEKLAFDDATQLEVTDASGFTDSGSAFIGTEKVTWTGKSGNTLTGVTRGAAGTFKSAHTAGEVLVETTSSATFTVADAERETIGDLYVRNPFNGEIVRVTTALTKTVDDASTDASTTATITLSVSELEDLVQALSQSPEVEPVASGTPAYTTEQWPSAEKVGSTRSTDNVRERRHAPIDGQGKTSRTNHGSFPVVDVDTWHCEFSTRPPFDRLETQEINLRVQRVSGSANLEVWSSPAGGSAPVTKHYDAATVTDGLVTFTTTKGDAGATDPKWWVSTDSGQWEIYAFWRELNTDEDVEYTPSEITIEECQLRRHDDGVLVYNETNAKAPATYDGVLTTGGNYGSNSDDEFRWELDGGWEDALYRISFNVGRDTDTGDETPSGGFNGAVLTDYALAHCLAVDTESANDGSSPFPDPDHYRSFFVLPSGESASATWGDSGGIAYDMDDAGYSDTWDGDGPQSFWVDGADAAAAGHQFLCIRRFAGDNSRWIRDITVEKIVADAPTAASVTVKGASIGYGLEFFADVDGPVAPSGATPAYKAGTGNVLTGLTDLLRYLLEEEAGETIDSDSYDDATDALQAVLQPASDRLFGGIGSTNTFLTLDESEEFPASGEIRIDSEEISYTGNANDVLSGLTRGINGTTAAAHADQAIVTNITAVDLPAAGDLRVLGLTGVELLAGLAFHGGINLVPVETSTGTVWKMLTAEADGSYPAASVTLTDWEPGGFVELGRDLAEELWTRAVYLYDLDPSLGSGDAAYAGALRASSVAAEHDLSDPTDSEIDTVETKLGRRDADSPIPYPLLHSVGAADLVAGRDLADRIGLPRLIGISGCPWWEGHAIEVGDIVEATPPWESSAVKLRVIGYTKRTRDELVDLVLVEVT